MQMTEKQKSNRNAYHREYYRKNSEKIIKKNSAYAKRKRAEMKVILAEYKILKARENAREDNQNTNLYGEDKGGERTNENKNKTANGIVG